MVERKLILDELDKILIIADLETSANNPDPLDDALDRLRNFAELLRESSYKEVELISYASGSGALSFTYQSTTERKATGHPSTIAEVANSPAWENLQSNIKNFDYLLADFGSEKYPEILAFGPVRRLGPNKLRMYAYERCHDVRYEEDGFRHRVFAHSDIELGTGVKEYEILNLSMVGIVHFFLTHEKVCTEALALRDLREDTAGKPHLVPKPESIENGS